MFYIYKKVIRFFTLHHNAPPLFLRTVFDKIYKTCFDEKSFPTTLMPNI